MAKLKSSRSKLKSSRSKVKKGGAEAKSWSLIIDDDVGPARSSAASTKRSTRKETLGRWLAYILIVVLVLGAISLFLGAVQYMRTGRF